MNYLDEIKQEMNWSILADNCTKDILIVVHNQLEYVKKCLDSLFINTSNFNLYLWNNNSNKNTTEYLKSISQRPNVKLFNSKKNLGFIVPNNLIIKECNSDWVVFINSDTEVIKNWDSVLIGAMMNNPQIAQTGFQGGILNKNGECTSTASGFNIDYICGYCFCINKKTYEEFGLFDDKNLNFAYCEDSDFSLRLKEKEKKIYACYSSELVRHYGSKTSIDVFNKNNELTEIIKKNRIYLVERWKHIMGSFTEM
jgi:GT2 family glycosyltransferase